MAVYEIQFRPATRELPVRLIWTGQLEGHVEADVEPGIRYDVSLPRTDRYNRQNWFDPNAVNPLNGGKITYNDPLTCSLSPAL